jgi:hypothetical protein
MQDRPTAVELLHDIADLLEGEVVPALSGPLQHQVRVAGNLCRIIERELTVGPGAEAREIEVLNSLLGEHDDDALALNQELVDRLRKGASADPQFERDAWDALVQIVKGKLSVAKPGHDSYDFAPEVMG